MDSSLDAQSIARKDRLAKLRNLKRKQEDGSDADAEPTEASSIVLSGRNYDVETKAPKFGFDTAPSANQETLETRVVEIAKETQKAIEEEKHDKNIDLFSLQPKKPNWDLKRDVDGKIQRLEARTDNAIARIVRDRILAQSQNKDASANADALGEENLADAVRRREKEKNEINDDDDDFT